MNRKPKPKLPAGWDVYSSANRKPGKRRAIPPWKYAIWVLVILALAVVAFFPWQVGGR
ncbi:hypothetical protein BH10PSE13_BH10PSE13_23820 [soil metagenome]